ncbi:YbaN family protein [Sinimarinibacterium sp. NLF-5-8]|uniref:YbaN family protein n=1 Tax=Sinimarinibacterium sp. NLF-5-8 TaxID=2698684 RepID=UPI00137BAE5F|nr:YbaN family protein [Sinimarinibacterium sp. NLF-5-8]QHS10787.1 DUF454 domain-containing protein [Sinimarinibacterium sp. NLF-5-8]
MTPPSANRYSSLPRWQRILLIIAGFISLLLGIIGALLPVMPTTPFIILAAACFARSSERFHQMLLRNRIFGPLLVEWETHRSIPYRTKLIALAMLAVTLGSSVVLFVRPLQLQLAVAAVGVLVGIWLYRIPSRN